MLSPRVSGMDPIEAARTCLDAGRLQESEVILEKFLAGSPRHAAGRCLAGYAAILKGHYAEADSHSAIAVESDPLLFDAQYVRAFTLSGLGRFDDACRAFRRVLALDPSCSFARLRMAEMLVQHGRKDEARRLLDEGRVHGITDDDIAAVLSLEDDSATEGRSSEGSEDVAPSGEVGIEWIDPRELLHAGRLDIVAKYLYARQLLGEPPLHSGFDAEDVYLRHIQYRTGGAEPGDEARKGNLAGFAQQTAQLASAMRDRGYDPSQPIPVARHTGLILNGAHRVAVALALGIRRVPVVYRDDVDGLTWDFDWFIDNGFSPHEMDEIVRVWIHLKGERAGCIMLWPPVDAHWDEIEGEIAERMPIVARRDFAFTPPAFAELVRDIYATDWGPIVGENIERKVAFFSTYAPRVRLLVVQVPMSGKDVFPALKSEMRDRYHHAAPADRFATLHTTDTACETAHVADIFLNPANLEALRHRPEPGMRPEFMEWVRDYHSRLQSRRINPEDCCVVGSAVLDLFGVRPATDLDFTVTHAVRARHFTPGVTHLTSDLDVVAQDYPREVGRAPFTDNDLIRDRALHVRFRGLKFASLDIVVKRKLMQRRPKDLSDVALVGRARLVSRDGLHAQAS